MVNDNTRFRIGQNKSRLRRFWRSLVDGVSIIVASFAAFLVLAFMVAFGGVVLLAGIGFFTVVLVVLVGISVVRGLK